MIDLADPRLWIAGTCALLILATAAISAVWGHFNQQENDR